MDTNKGYVQGGPLKNLGGAGAKTDRIGPFSALKSADRPWLKRLLYPLFGLDKLDRLYTELPSSGSVDEFLDNLLIKLDINPIIHEPYEQSFAQGPLLVVANHPCGLIDGVLLLSFLLKKRPDTQLLANQLLLKIPELSNTVLGVMPFDDMAALRHNHKSLQEAYRWLSEDHCLACFPAGNVSRLQFSELPGLKIEDAVWTDQIIRIARTIQQQQDKPLNLLPVYFSARNSWPFYLSGLFGKQTHSLLYVHEFLNKSASSIDMVIGKLINLAEIEQLDRRNATNFLRSSAYSQEKHL